jgi:4-phytase/acid phosphatase
MGMKNWYFGALLALAAPGALADARDNAGLPAGLRVDRVVLLMRHGVRPPTKAPSMPADVTPERWPDWPVNPGWLTPHGAQAVGALGKQDRAAFAAAGLLPARGCPAPGTVAIVADSDQRTIATAQSWSGALLPGCTVTIDHRPQDAGDPLFSPGQGGDITLDAGQAEADIAAAVGPGGIAAVEASHRPLLHRLDHILCGTRPAPCGVSATPSAIVPGAAGKRPKLSGALDRASTAAQILLLEYAEGKPLAQVGWGRASAADVTALSAFHALEFRILARPRAVAAFNVAHLAPRIALALRDDAADAPRVTMFSGHDTNVASLAGLLDLHWTAPSFAADDPAPGGAIVFERLRDAGGGIYVRAAYRSQTLRQLRTASAVPAYRMEMRIAGCSALGIDGLCTMKQFLKRINTRS